jgi:hypothetical protein
VRRTHIYANLVKSGRNDETPCCLFLTEICLLHRPVKSQRKTKRERRRKKKRRQDDADHPSVAGVQVECGVEEEEGGDRWEI